MGQNSTEATIHRISKLLRTQDNRATSDPIFLVQEKMRIWGVNSDYSENSAWVNPYVDYEEADEDKTEELDDLELQNKYTRPWVRVGYIDRWEFVTACLTEDACKDYIERNRHNLNEPRIYVTSGYRNVEFIAVRNFLMQFNDTKG